MTKRILIADDSGSIREMLAFVLTQAGYEVLSAQDGQEALDKAPAFGPHLIITDLNMPNLNGIDLVKNLRGMTSFRFTPILVLTTEGQDEKKQAGKAAGATGWLVKPFKPEKLLAVVGKVLPN
ncbi:MAG TPA: response regulator [Candidatus Rifleibacterium sp.]|nr:response regulator [Candidatus Rifleibacterium sp.]HPW57024.1 response regulator [Candidatus Rifleibacterium sp.]